MYFLKKAAWNLPVFQVFDDTGIAAPFMVLGMVFAARLGASAEVFGQVNLPFCLLDRYLIGKILLVKVVPQFLRQCDRGKVCGVPTRVEAPVKAL